MKELLSPNRYLDYEPIIVLGYQFQSLQINFAHFAYSQPFHQEVIVKTRKENWYAEDMFVRFIPLAAEGTLQGIDPFIGKL